MANDALGRWVDSLPERYKTHTLDNFNPHCSGATNALQICKAFAKTFPKKGGGMFFSGQTGTGKTMLAVAICTEIKKNKPRSSVKYTTANRIIRAVRSSWGGGSETEDEVIKSLVKHDLLVIDEIGSQYGTESEKIIINEIINDRYDNCKSTIIIGNITYAEAVEVLGDRVISRVIHNGCSIVFDWQSQRKGAKNV